MRRLIVLTLLAAPLAALSAGAHEIGPPPQAQPAERGGVALINRWIWQYMGRAPNCADLQNGAAIDCGRQDPVARLALILACDEYYNRHGGEDCRYVQALFIDVAGRQPARQEMDYWVRRLHNAPPCMEGRAAITSDLLQGYPPDLCLLKAPQDVSRRPDYQDRYSDRDRGFELELNFGRDRR